MTSDDSDWEIGEFAEDGALDERDSVIEWLAARIDESVSNEGFCGVDVSGVRANIAILATIIGTHGGEHLIARAKVRDWAQRIDAPFTDDESWGFEPWPEEVKQKWRAGCQETVGKLLSVLEEDEEE